VRGGLGGHGDAAAAASRQKPSRNTA